MEQRIRMLQRTIEQAFSDQGRITEKTGQNTNNTFRFTMVSDCENKISLRCLQAGRSPELIFHTTRKCGAPRLSEHARFVRSLKTVTTHSPSELGFRVATCGGISGDPLLTGDSHDATSRTLLYHDRKEIAE